MNLYDELLGLVDLLEKHKIEYAICGGLALGILGHPRMTRDIDLLVRAEDLERLTEVVKARGFTVPAGRIPFRLGQPSEQVVHRVNKVAGGQLLTLDLLILPPFLADVWDGRIKIQWQGRHVQIVSREGLVKMKRLAGVSRTSRTWRSWRPPSMTPRPPPDRNNLDLSPAAVDARIRELADLWDFWMRLELDRRDGKLSGPGVRITSAVAAFR